MGQNRRYLFLGMAVDLLLVQSKTVEQLGDVGFRVVRQLQVDVQISNLKTESRLGVHKKKSKPVQDISRQLL